MSNSNPLVSVIVITYNSAKFVLQTLDSVKNQSYKNIELVISDDGSSDDTVNACKNWLLENKERFFSAHIINVDKNSGTPSNCNRGIKLAHGDWVKIIAGDDLLIENCIEKNLLFALESGSKFIFSNVIRVDDNGHELTGASQFDLKYFSYFTSLPSNLQQAVYCRVPMTINAPTWFLSMEAIKDVGGFDEGYMILEDQTFIYKYLNRGFNVCFMNELTVKYRIHAASVVKSINSKLANDYLKCFHQYRFKSLKRQGIIGWYYILFAYIFNMRHIQYNRSRFLYLAYTIVARIFPRKGSMLYFKLLSYKIR